MKVSNLQTSPWRILAEDFPTYGVPTPKWEFLLGYAILAPSSHNSQPWLFHLPDSHLELYADRNQQELNRK